MLVSVNMCQYLRLCDNHCDLQLGPVGDHCGDCRKRKEHGVEGENEWKFSKHSPESTVSFLMRKWNNTEVDSQNGNIIHAPIVDEVYRYDQKIPRRKGR